MGRFESTEKVEGHEEIKAPPSADLNERNKDRIRGKYDGKEKNIAERRAELEVRHKAEKRVELQKVIPGESAFDAKRRMAEIEVRQAKERRALATTPKTQTEYVSSARDADKRMTWKGDQSGRQDELLHYQQAGLNAIAAINEQDTREVLGSYVGETNVARMVDGKKQVVDVKKGTKRTPGAYTTPQIRQVDIGAMPNNAAQFGAEKNLDARDKDIEAAEEAGTTISTEIIPKSDLLIQHKGFRLAEKSDPNYERMMKIGADKIGEKDEVLITTSGGEQYLYTSSGGEYFLLKETPVRKRRRKAEKEESK